MWLIGGIDLELHTKTWWLFHKTSLPNKPGLFQLVWLIVNVIWFKISQTNWNKPGLFHEVCEMWMMLLVNVILYACGSSGGAWGELTSYSH